MACCHVLNELGQPVSGQSSMDDFSFFFLFVLCHKNSLVPKLTDLGLWLDHRLGPHVLGSSPAAFQLFGHLSNPGCCTIVASL